MTAFDVLLPGRAVVYGSLPPEGRDLDLVVPDADMAALAVAFEAAGFHRSGSRFARFDPDGVQVADLAPVGRWDLDDDEAVALFDEAIPLPGSGRLARPAPHHVLLLAARRLAATGTLDEPRRARVAAAVAEDPTAWEAARRRAPAWKATAALAMLRTAFLDGTDPTVAQRVAALAERRGRPAAVRAVTRRRRGAVVAFSGLDGSGKSSQTAALRATLEQLGYEVAVEWTRLSHNPGLYRVLVPVKNAVLPLAARLGGRRPPPADVDVDASRLRDPVKALRQRSRLGNQLWVAMMAVANANAIRGRVGPHVRRGRVVLCDRYTLDSVVHLRFRYGERTPFRLQTWIVRRFSPRPAAAFFLDIPPEEAWARKPEQYEPDQLRRQAALYRTLCESEGVVRLDGTRPADDLAREVAVIVWSRLGDAGVG